MHLPRDSILFDAFAVRPFGHCLLDGYRIRDFGLIETKSIKKQECIQKPAGLLTHKSQALLAGTISESLLNAISHFKEPQSFSTTLRMEAPQVAILL